MNQTDEQNLTRGSISKSLMSFAFPILAALFLQAMYGAVDLVIVGKFAGTYEQSAVATGSQLFQMITTMIVGVTMGLTVFIGTAAGAEGGEQVRQGIGTGIVMFSVGALPVTAAVVPLSDTLSALMKAPAEAFAQTGAYVRICGWGTLFIVAYNVLGAIFRGLGDSRTPLITVAIACGCNIAGDLLLVGVLQLGAAGAAAATVAAQGLSVLLSLLLLLKRGLPGYLAGGKLRFDRTCCRKILQLGVPVALQEVLVQFSFLFIQAIINGLGVRASAAVGVAEKVCGFLMLMASAYLQAISAFVAQNNGAGLFARSEKALRYGMRTSFLAGLITGSAAFFGGSFLASIFSSDAAVISLAHDYLKAYAIDCLLTAFLFCFIGYFNGCGRTLFVMLQGIFGAFGVRVPAVFLISRIPGVTLFQIGLATPLSSVAQILLCLAAHRRTAKALRAEKSPPQP